MTVNERGHRSLRAGLLASLAALAMTAAAAVLPAGASAASCPVTPGVFTTTWIGGSGHYNTDANWSNGAPSGSCDASIVAPGNYTVTMNGGSNTKSMTIGGVGSTPTLQISAEGPNTNLLVTTSALTVASGAAITLLCNVPPENCGAPNLSAPEISNAGTITVDASVNGTPLISGPLVNTGTLQFNHAAKFNNGAVTNKGTFNIANGVTASSGGSSCGDTSVSFKNDTGGTLNATGTGTFDVVNYEQGAGPTSGTNPVQIPCGSLKYSGSGASKVTAYGGFNLTGTIQVGQSLTVTNNSSNTNAVLGGNFTNNGAITLTCPTSSCSGPGFNIGANAFDNAGTFTVAAPVTTAGSVSGKLTNTGTMQFNGPARFDNSAVTNQGAFNIATGVTVLSGGSSCGDTSVLVKNDTGGSIVGTGTGTLSVVNYEQGAGTTSGTLPVQIPCGSLKYSGSGASKVQANGGFNLSGETQAGQSLIVSAAGSNTNAVLQGNFTNKGAITLTCPGDESANCSGGSGGGAGFNANGNTFTNEGTFTIAAGSGTGAGTSGGMINKGTIQFDQSAGLSGVVINQGTISIADGKTAISSTSSCGDSTPRVINDTGGQVKSVGTGTLSAVNFDQGAGTTSGTTPVSMNCGTLKYIGSGASTITVPGSATLNTDLSAGQTLRVAGQLFSSGFTNGGAVVLDQTGGSPSVNNSGTVVNTGTITTSGASANTASFGGTIEQTAGSAQVVVAAGTKLGLSNPLLLKAGKLSGAGTVVGSVNNSGGAVAPGSSPGTLSLSGSYTQGAAGTLQVEVDGTGAGQFDKLAIGGNATLGGTLALVPSAGYASAATPGNSVAFLTYGGTRSGEFATTTVNPALACPNKFAAAYDDGAKTVSAVVSSTGLVCNEPPPPPAAPKAKLGKHPKAQIKTTKSKVKVSFNFSADLAGSTFQCKLDKGAYASCKSPKSYKVKPGKHKFSVRAVGAGGTGAAVSFSFKVIRQKPKG